MLHDQALMEKRDHSRKGINLLSASIHCDGNIYYGVVENMSERGILAIASSREESAPFLPEGIVKVDIYHSSHECKGLVCEIRWVHINKTPIHGLTYRMGLEVMEESSGFRNLLSIIK
jgi:hypothetical protein